MSKLILLSVLHLIIIPCRGILDDQSCVNDTSISDSLQRYGVDISWPMHSYTVSNNYIWLPHNVDKNISTPPEYLHLPVQPLGDRQSIYEKYIKGCVNLYDVENCANSEIGRVYDNFERTTYMVNFTDIGFKKVKAPKDVFEAILEFWGKHKVTGRELEGNGIGETTNNHWESPAYMVDMEQQDLAGGEELRAKIWNSVEDEISAWVNLKLKTSALYGIRVYTEGAILAPHVDKLPRICSAIINVAQDVDEDWPLEVIGHDGLAHNITMEPGDMILYESHSIIHGRPFELKGRYYANIFIHFGPMLKNEGRPSYITDDAPEDIYNIWLANDDDSSDYADSSDRSGHDAAARGDLRALLDILNNEKSILFITDSNGWSPLHEAVRAGHVDVVEFLLSHGVNIDQITNSGESVFDLASEYQSSNTEMLEILDMSDDDNEYSSDYDEM